MSARWFDIVSGSSRGPASSVARGALSALSLSYSAAVSGRGLMYRAGLLKRYRAPVPVISVGNITAGGTGKTPLVERLARHLAEAGRRPAIVMRGYGHRHDSLGGQGDEAALLRHNLGDIPVTIIEEPRRSVGARAAFERHGCDVVVLDDGFQHLALERDLDIVAIDATLPFGFGRLLPRGLLREPPSALGRAQVIVVTRADLVGADELDALARRLRELAPKASIHAAAYEPTSLTPAFGEGSEPVERLRGEKVALFCGIGNPGAFRASVERTGAEVVMARAFPDHHAFTRAVISVLADAARASKAAKAITTQKDAVRIAPGWWPADSGAPGLHVLRAELRFLPRSALFDDEACLMSKVDSAAKPAGK